MDKEQLLAKLNKEQQRAVSAPRGNILVLAGAGSGKTRILVHRIAWLLSQESVDTRNILAVTFTNKAANEMRKRISALLRAPTADMWVGTFHGLANRMLRIFHEAAGLAQDFQILDSDDQKRLIKRMLKDANVSEKYVRPASLQGFINRNKDAGIRAAAAQQRAESFQSQQLASLYQTYETACERAQVVDFAELLLRAYELLDNAEVLARLQGRFTEILVDEFQDTNTIQYAWLRKICGAHNHIMAVGDDDQSIYGWRGAQIANIQAFSREMPDAVTIRSEQNYRSTDTILQAANSLIKNNNNRLGKNLWTEYGLGEAITHYHAFNAQDEARYLVQALLSSCERNDWRLDDCAILYRSNAQSRILEEELRHHNVPYRIYGGQRFFERLEIKNTLAYARLMVNNQDDSAFERVVNTPPRGLGDRSLTELRGQARTQEISLWDAAERICRAGAGRMEQNLQAFLNLIQELRALCQSLTLSESMSVISEHSGLIAMYAKQSDGRKEAREENLAELASAASQFPIPDGSDGMAEFLQHVALDSGDQGEDNRASVQLMTLHSAKGLEFPWVAIAGFEEGLLPHANSQKEEHLVEEERRLAYVGITRAMRKLVLSDSETRVLGGQAQLCRVSRFFWEIPKELVDPVNKSWDQSNRAQYANSVRHTQQPRPASSSGDFAASSTQGNAFAAFQSNAAANTAQPKFSLGESVYHTVFGTGIVEDYEQNSGDDRVLVAFEQRGRKWLLVEFANLQRAN